MKNHVIAGDRMEKYDLNVYYFDSDSYNLEQYKKIINMNLTVPSKFNNGVQFKLSEGFGTPLTIITKNNKVIDCISGYVNRARLIETLKSNDMLREILIKNIKGYVIDIKNGKILTNEELLNKYNLSLDEVKKKVSSKLDESQSTSEDDTEIIKKEEKRKEIKK